MPQPPAQPAPPPATASQDQPSAFDDAEPPGELEIPPERPESDNPRGRFPSAASIRGGHAYIPASGLRPSANGQNGHRSANGYVVERRTGPPVSPGDDDEGDDAGMGSTPKTWRIERLNGGSDTTPRESTRPESRGEMGPLIDSLHELFAQDRMVASQGDVTRCGICYLHFPLSALEHRGAEGFYVCAGCKRTLGHQQLMMVRRQQPPRNG
ncbi:MAG TPA: hypothetical protein VFU63_10155 [Ktedonobacterales bacterium]|nr:hypothetical protein [Ktedonobacterales bacterium]